MDRTTTPQRDNHPPLVSVIIPAYNADQFIAQAIQSVVAQTYRSYEIIVVDDGSTDKTKEVLKTFGGKIHCLYQENKGPSAARNAGIKIAQGKYICFLDADDLWTPGKIKTQCEFMEQNTDIALVFSDYEELSEEGIVLASWLGEKHQTFGACPILTGPIDNAFEKLVFENFITTPTVMVRKSCLEKTGLFDEGIWSVEDRDLWLRISASFRIACIPRIFCKKRVHQSNISKVKELSLQGKIKVLEKNWELFPVLAPSGLWRSQLADYYCEFGYLLLEKNQRGSALKAGILSLKHYVLQGFSGPSWRSTPWWICVRLIPAALLGWKLSRSLWQPLKRRK